MDLSEKVALVTGAAVRIGRAIALALAREGAHVVVHYGESVDDARLTVQDIRALGVEALPVQANLANADEVARLFESIRERFGRLDVLVNSAASFQPRAFDTITVEDFDRVMAVNLRAPFLAIQHAARLMRSVERPAGKTGLIVNLSDLSGLHPWKDYAHHAVSKAGLLHLTRIAARELAPGIRVNAVVPGPILPPPGQSEDSEAWQHTGDRVPLLRVGDPAYVVQAIVFLARNDYITGEVLTVDGGEHLLGPVGH